MKAKVVLVQFPFTDLSGSKLRPAIGIHESDPDVIVAFISSRRPPTLESTDLLLAADDPAFGATGLKTASVIKFDKIATLAKTLIRGEIGEISPSLAAECNRIMDRIFRL